MYRGRRALPQVAPGLARGKLVGRPLDANSADEAHLCARPTWQPTGRGCSSTMIQPGPHEKLYPAFKLATIVSALQAERVSPAQALQTVNLSTSDLTSPRTRVSLDQVIRCYRAAIRLATDPQFAYHAGLRFHVSTYGMYGFAILSSTNFRQTMHFAVNYHQLATPLADISFKEEPERGIWTIDPVPHPDIDAELYRFLVELQFGIHTSLHCDVMGASFAPRELHVTYGPSGDARKYAEVFGCRVVFAQPENRFMFDATWLDAAPRLGTEATYSWVLSLCDQLLEELRLGTGLAGKVRETLLVNLARPTSFNAVARHLKMTTRTLRRKLREENTSFRELVDELRMQVAIKYLRDTDLTVEDIAFSLGFSEAANFRHAFRQWTKKTPSEFRYLARTSRDD
jgi:AraC-like DNA-binding protein